METTSPEARLFDLLAKPSVSGPSVSTEGSEAEKIISRGDPDYGTPVTVRNLFTHQDTHPVVLNLAMMREFQMDWVGWEPRTIWSEINRLFKSQVSEHTRAKVQALMALHNNNGFWKSWTVFEKVVQALNGNIPTWTVMQMPSPEQLYVAVDMLEHIRSGVFSDEVKLYMTAAILHEDLTFVPPPLDFIQLEVSQPYYTCETCGQEVSALFHDKFCDSCTKKFHHDQGLSMRPKAEIVNQGVGLMTEGLRHDPVLVSLRWEEVKSVPSEKVHLKEDAVDNQVHRLLLCRDMMNIKRRQLTEQLTSLKSWMRAQ